MPKYVKNKSGYSKIEYDVEAVKKAYQKKKSEKKFPTSVNLPKETVTELKKIAQQQGLPYQTLMRMLIIQGLDQLRSKVKS